MTSRRRQIENLFERALAVPPSERRWWLARVAGEDRELQSQVEELLEAHGRAEGVLERGDPRRLVADALADARPVSPETVLGRYRIVGEIGRGGTSTVYLAERADGQFERTVAIKVVREGPFAEDLERRVRTERQILASLDHPAIARLLDADLTEDGRPYLVMEHVEGLPLDVHCDRHRLPVAERLGLFCQVAHVVHHAHRNLVLHRDLKPSNVLVTAEGRPKLLDFGIARILEAGPAGAASPPTRRSAHMMTPEYASPEQVRGDPLTTASDVYSLGVLLYELLCGHRPYELGSGSPREVLEAVCERTPEPPSRRIRASVGFVCGTGRPVDAQPPTIADARRSSPERLERRLRGDLDAIALKALRKEPGERYASAEALARDIERHRRGLPVEAHRGGHLYRARKLVRRHRSRAVILAVAAVALVVTAGIAAWQAATASRERDLAREARLEAEAALARARDVSAALADVLEAGDPLMPGFRDTAIARQLLDLGRARVAALEGRPTVQAGLLDVLARACAARGDLEGAERMARRSLALRREALGGDHPEVAASLNVLGEVLRRAGRYREAEAAHREALDLQLRRLEPDHPDVAETLTLLASHLPPPGALTKAEELYARALAIRRATLGPYHPLVASSLVDLGRARKGLGRPEEAETAFREALEIQRATLGPDHHEVAETMSALADVVRLYGGPAARAESLYRRALEIAERAGGAQYPLRMHALGSLATLLSDEGRHAEAERTFREALQLRRTAFGDRHRAVAEGLGHLAGELRAQGRLAEAERLHREALGIWRDALPADHPAVAGAAVNLAEVLVDRGRYDEAETLFHEALAIRRRALGEGHGAVGLVFGSLGRLQARRGESARAESLYRRAVEVVASEWGDGHHDARRLRRELAELYDGWGRPQEAAKYRRLAEVVDRR